MPSIHLFPGDCLEVMKTPSIPDGMYDAVITDPPYYLRYADKIEVAGLNVSGGQIDFDTFESNEAYEMFTREWIALAEHKLRKGGSFICFTGIEKLGFILDTMEDLGLIKRGALFWHKTNPPIRTRKVGYLSSVEPCIWTVKPKGKTYFRFTDQEKMHNWRSGYPWVEDDEWDNLPFMDFVIDGSSTLGNERTIHRTQKPLYLMRDILLTHVPPGGTILDPFGGSGSTAVAARALGMNCDIIEKDVRFLDVIRSRLRKPVQLEMMEEA